MTTTFDSLYRRRSGATGTLGEGHHGEAVNRRSLRPARARLLTEHDLFGRLRPPKHQHERQFRETCSVVWISSNMIPGSNNLNGFSALPFLNLAIGEMQETSHWPPQRWNVMSEQRQSNWQHPNSYYREREET